MLKPTGAMLVGLALLFSTLYTIFSNLRLFCALSCQTNFLGYTANNIRNITVMLNIFGFWRSERQIHLSSYRIEPELYPIAGVSQ
jgi:hypothetical protein